MILRTRQGSTAINSLVVRSAAYSTRNAQIPIENAPGWREDLATPSEASVKADRAKTSLDEMRKRTVDHAQTHCHDPDGERTHATYAREEVHGPLGHAGVGEFEGLVGSDDLGPDAQLESNGRVVSRQVKNDKGTTGQANV